MKCKRLDDSGSLTTAGQLVLFGKEYYINHHIIAERAESFEAKGKKYRGGTITASPLRHCKHLYEL